MVSITKPRINAENPSTHRFCKHCSAIIGIENFKPSSTKRVCRKHERQLYVQNMKNKQTPESKIAYLLLWRLKSDTQRCFQRSYTMSIKEIMSLSLTAESNILPADPSKPTTIRNCVVASASQKALLVRTWANDQDVETYQTMLRCLKLSPVEASASSSAQSSPCLGPSPVI